MGALLLFLFLFSLALQQLIWISQASSTSAVRCHVAEREALMEFNRGLRDPSARLSAWVGHDCCSWEGIHCSNVTSHVVQLDLRNRHMEYYGDCSDETSDYWRWDGYGCRWALIGNISWSLLSLHHLRHMDLSGNSFQHNLIPEFMGSFRRLTYLNLSGAGFRGKVPSQLGNLSHLHHLDLSYNFYIDDTDYETSPDLYIFESAGWISQLTSLRVLNMEWVDLRNASDWLQAMSTLPRIQEIRLASCRIVSSSPQNSLLDVNFTSLITLDLSSNDINSSIPNWLFNLSSLEHLDLGWNNLKWLDLTSISKFPSLRLLDLSSNVLQHGSIPTALRNLCKLQSLYLNDVDINDEIMNLQGAFSRCLKLSLEELELSSNQLRGNLPDWLWSMNNLKLLYLYNNSLYGPVPQQLGRLSSLQYLDISENNLNETIAEGMFRGMKELITLEIGDNSLSLLEVHLADLPATLEFLDISFNTLVLNESHKDWIIPFQLTDLLMSYCKILPKPKFPKWIQTQRVLSSLYLSSMGIKDTFPTWFPTTLEDLDLSKNSFSD